MKSNEDRDEVHSRGTPEMVEDDEQDTDPVPGDGEAVRDHDAAAGGREQGGRNKMVGAMMQCRSCAERQPGCWQGCAEYAVRKIMAIITEPDRRAARQLREDSYAMQQERYIKRMRERRRMTWK